MTGQHMTPPQEDKLRLNFRAEYTVQDRGDHDRKPHRKQLFGVGEHPAKTVQPDCVRLDYAPHKERVDGDDDPKLPAILVLERTFGCCTSNRRCFLISHNSPPPS